jgi:hypothetical protein
LLHAEVPAIDVAADLQPRRIRAWLNEARDQAHDGRAASSMRGRRNDPAARAYAVAQRTSMGQTAFDSTHSALQA